MGTLPGALFAQKVLYGRRIAGSFSYCAGRMMPLAVKYVFACSPKCL